MNRSKPLCNSILSGEHLTNISMGWKIIFKNQLLLGNKDNQKVLPNRISFCIIIPERLLCPQLRRWLRGILVSGCASVHSSRTVHARVLKFHIWIPHGKIADTHYFSCLELSPFLELCSFEKIRMKSDACHILRTVHVRVLQFHVWIPHD